MFIIERVDNGYIVTDADEWGTHVKVYKGSQLIDLLRELNEALYFGNESCAKIEPNEMCKCPDCVQRMKQYE